MSLDSSPQIAPAVEFVNDLYDGVSVEGKSQYQRAVNVISGMALAIGMEEGVLVKRLIEHTISEQRKIRTSQVKSLVWDIVCRRENTHLVPRNSYSREARQKVSPSNTWSLTVEDAPNESTNGDVRSASLG